MNDSSLNLKCHRERWGIEIALRIALLKPQKRFDCRDRAYVRCYQQGRLRMIVTYLKASLFKTSGSWSLSRVGSLSVLLIKCRI